jgi:hypothetical protein
MQHGPESSLPTKEYEGEYNAFIIRPAPDSHVVFFDLLQSIASSLVERYDTNSTKVLGPFGRRQLLGCALYHCYLASFKWLAPRSRALSPPIML